MEVWKPVVGYEGYYDVSDRGRVRNSKTGYVRSLYKRPKLYVSVNIGGGRPRKTNQVHRLVAEAFHGPCPKGMECAHQNGDSHDNRAENLRWTTPLENARQRDEHGTQLRGEQLPQTKLTAKKVLEIRKRRESGETFKKIARDYGLRPETVFYAVKGTSWNHLER